MFFASDNTGPVHPKIMAALAAANDGYAMPYGADPLAGHVRDRLREIFEAPEAAIYLVATGTAANSLLLASHAGPWQTIFCSEVAHIHEDECNAPEFFSGGAKLTLVPHDGGKITPEALRARIEAEESRGVHGPQRGPVSITQATEKGRVYTPDEVRALSAVAREFGLPLHMDGARFANALVHLDCTPAEMTWKAGVNLVSFGATKNGAMGVEAAILFDPAKAWEFELRRKRGAHLFSKHRYLSAQMLGYLEGGAWRDAAHTANARAARLAEGLRAVPGAEMAYDREVNMIFARLPRATHRRLRAAGAAYALYEGTLDAGPDDEPLMARFVCDWSVGEAEIDRFLEMAAG